MFPRWGMERASARLALLEAERLIAYREGRNTPRDRQVFDSGASPDYSLELGYDRRDMVDKARGLERENSIAQSLLDRSCEHVVGEGFALKPKTKDLGWNLAARDYFLDWCMRADARGILNFHEICNIAYRSWLRDGDFGVVLEGDTTLRMTESDEIASKIGGFMTPSDVDGVELDKRGRIRAYTVFDYDPSVNWSDRRRAIPRLTRIPAEQFIFLARRIRAGQTRGISAFCGIVWLLEQLDDVFEAIVTAHHMAACMGLVLQKKQGVAPLPGRPGGGDADLYLRPGKVWRVDPGELPFQITPTHPTDSFKILTDKFERIAGSRFGVNSEAVLYNFNDANYSNLRAGKLESGLSTRIKQRGMMSHFASHVWLFVLADAIRRGKLPPRDDAFLHAWGGAGQPWIDPEVELRAAQGSVDAGLDTRRAILARRGLDFDEVIAEIAEENGKMRKLGLPDVRSTLTRDAISVTKTITEQKPEEGGARPKPPASKQSARPQAINRVRDRVVQDLMRRRNGHSAASGPA